MGAPPSPLSPHWAGQLTMEKVVRLHKKLFLKRKKKERN